jgi:hypothetical protein
MQWTLARNRVNLSPFKSRWDFFHFDMSTGLWDVSAFTTAPDVSVNLPGMIALRSNGDIVIIFYSTSGGNRFSAYVYSGGIWSAAIPETGFTAVSLTMQGLCVDASDTIHLIVYGKDAGVPPNTAQNNLWDLPFDSSNNWSAPILAQANVGNNAPGDGMSVVYNSTADSVDLCYIDNNSFPTFTLQFLSGVPSSSPVYTQTTIDTMNGFNGQLARILTATNGNYSTEYIAYAKNWVGSYPTHAMLASNSGGGWSSSVVWDTVADPPSTPGGVTFAGIDGVESASVIAGQPYIFIVADDFSDSFSLAYMLQPGTVPPPLVVYSVGGTGVPIGWAGPLSQGTDLWIGSESTATSNSAIGYFQSTDGGTTWTEIDAANEPIFGAFAQPLFSTAIIVSAPAIVAARYRGAIFYD